MKHIFFIIDCSGSIVSEGATKVGQINDLVRDAITSCRENGAMDIRVICYANGSKEYWKSSEEDFFIDIAENKFGGRSNLGKAYGTIKKIVTKEKFFLPECLLVLVSDGEATDNYKKSLLDLDPQKETIRIAISIGNSTSTTDKHVIDDDLAFKNGIRDRDVFIEKIIDCI